MFVMYFLRNNNLSFTLRKISKTSINVVILCDDKKKEGRSIAKKILYIHSDYLIFQNKYGTPVYMIY